jgi:hypothetical protein
MLKRVSVAFSNQWCVSERQCVVDQVKVPACMFEWVLGFSHDASRACSRILTAGLELEETRLLRSPVRCD